MDGGVLGKNKDDEQKKERERLRKKTINVIAIGLSPNVIIKLTVLTFLGYSAQARPLSPSSF